MWSSRLHWPESPWASARSGPQGMILTTMKIPVWSFIRMARLAGLLMPGEDLPTLYVLYRRRYHISDQPVRLGHTKRAMYSPPLQNTAFNIIDVGWDE